MNWRTVVLELICFLFIVLFVYAAFNKVLEFQKFKIQIGQSPLLTGFGEVLPGVVIATELLIAVLVAIPQFRLAGLFAAFSLMTMFTTYIAVLLNFSSYLPCSCGGVLEKLGWTEHLYFNIGFVLLGLVGIVLHARDDEGAHNLVTTQ